MPAMASSGPVIGSTSRIPADRSAWPVALVVATVARDRLRDRSRRSSGRSARRAARLPRPGRAIGAVYIGSGVVAWQRRPEVLTGPLLLACGVLNFVGSYGPTELPGRDHLGFAFEGYFDVALAVLVLALPHRWPKGPTRWLAIAHARGVPRSERCRACSSRTRSMFGCDDLPSNPFALASEHGGVHRGRDGVERGHRRRWRWSSPASAPAPDREPTGRPAHDVADPRRRDRGHAGAALDAAEYAYSTATGGPLLDLPEPWDGCVRLVAVLPAPGRPDRVHARHPAPAARRWTAGRPRRRAGPRPVPGPAPGRPGCRARRPGGPPRPPDPDGGRAGVRRTGARPPRRPRTSGTR